MLTLTIAVDLEQNRQAILCVATGRNQLIKVSLTLTTASADVTFGIETAEMILGSASSSLCRSSPIQLIELAQRRSWDRWSLADLCSSRTCKLPPSSRFSCLS